MTGNGQTNEEITREPEQLVELPDPWLELQIYTDQTSEFPTVSQDSKKQYQPCVLYRGGENWLSRFVKGMAQTEQIQNIRQEVRAIGARWLKMQNLCVLLGAGASMYATGFVGADLFKYARSLLEGRASNAILEAFLKYVGEPDDIGKRLEEFLSQLAALAYLTDTARGPLDRLPIEVPLEGADKSKTLNQVLKEVLLDLERAIAVSCNGTLPPSKLISEDGEVTPHESFLAKLVARDPQQGRARIFTTNYDTLIEQAMDRLGIIYSDGFTGSVNRRFNPSIYDLDLHYPGEVTEGRVRRYDKVVHLYKLHGSINWRRSDGSAQNPYGIVFDNHPLPTRAQVKKDNKILENTFDEGQSLAILPTAGKYGESLAMPFAHLFRSMGQALREPQTVLFVNGYSGWDWHINQMIEDALTNPGFVCVIVDPVPSKWGQKLCQADYCGRVYCIGGQWGKFEFFSQYFLPDLEVLKTELAVARTLRDLRKGFAEGQDSDES